MPSSLDIDLAALTLATAHYRLINEGLIDQPANISSLDSYQSISAFLIFRYFNFKFSNSEFTIYLENIIYDNFFVERF